MAGYIIAIDQSTQGTKALLFDETGALVYRADKAHRQISDGNGWLSHDAEEIYENLIVAVGELLNGSGIDKNMVVGVGISNQRETSLIWNEDGIPLGHAVVWQCTRSREICEAIAESDAAEIYERTGIPLSPYYPVSKLSWLIENIDGAKELARKNKLKLGTVDTWLLYRLTKGKAYKTDYSNASRTQMFDIYKLEWDEWICGLFGMEKSWMAQVCDSNELFGTTDFEGLLEKPVGIYCMMGDSHAALFAQGCHAPGMIKATYGTGSSIMMNVGGEPVGPKDGIVASIAWGMDGNIDYVLEGNVMYTGGTVSWLKNNLGIVENAADTHKMAIEADRDDATYMVPAFTGLGAPYWNSGAKALIYGMGVNTGRNEIVKAALECIAYQVNDVLRVMEGISEKEIGLLRTDGGASGNGYLMQFQSDISGAEVYASRTQELSGAGVAYMAGIKAGLYDDKVFENMKYDSYKPVMDGTIVKKRLDGWRTAVNLSLSGNAGRI